MVKIGYTSRGAKKRMGMLQTACPEPLELLGVIAGKMSLERELHKRFAKHRSHGEWFHPSSEILSFIAEETRQLDQSGNFEPT